MINVHGGGNHANKNGVHFEQDTSLPEALKNLNITLIKNNKIKSKLPAYDIYQDGVQIGMATRGARMYNDIFEPHNVDYKEHISQKLCPDDVFMDMRHNTVFIIEKKFQSRAGSVDEKLQTCDFKKKQYEKLFGLIGYEVKYIYVFNDWFKQERYKDVLEYIIASGCYYFFNEIPVSFLGL